MLMCVHAQSCKRFELPDACSQLGLERAALGIPIAALTQSCPEDAAGGVGGETV